MPGPRGGRDRAERALALDEARERLDVAEGLPRGYRERRVASLFTEVLGVPIDRASADFFALGGDADAAARLLDVIEEDAGLRLAPGTIERYPTVRALSGHIATSHATRRSRVIGYGTDLPGRPLFCVMNAFQARVIARQFVATAGRPFYVVQRAGIEGRAKPDRTVAARARRAVQDIRSVQPNGPYQIAGYCGDAWVAFEAARRLRSAGEQVDVLFVIDLWAPVFSPSRIHRLRQRTRWQRVTGWEPERGRFFDARRRALFLREMERDYAAKIKWQLYGLPLGWVQYPTTKQSKVLFEMSTPFLDHYRPDTVDFDVTLVRGIPYGGYDWAVRRAAPDMSWGQVTTGKVDVVSISGDHVSMLERETGRELGDVLARLVDDRAAADMPVSPQADARERSVAAG